MNKDLIFIMEKNLNDYRRAISKAGRNLEIKANITRKTAIELIKFLEKEQQISTETSTKNISEKHNY